jgi:hypothetical protein
MRDADSFAIDDDTLTLATPAGELPIFARD